MKKISFEEIPGGITAVPGFLAAAARAGIKYPDREDLAVIYSEREAVAAGTFTTNRIVASSVVLTRERLRKGKARAIVVNSGNANACNGREGLRASREMTRLVAGYLKIPEADVCIASTGVIGQPLPMDKIRKALPEGLRNLGPDGGGAAARAIMTTDTFPKEVAIRGRVDGRTVTVGGMAKGSGMIAPDMATMLGFLATDMQVGKSFLRKTLREAVGESFNRITVDGDTSTNDMVLCLANGAAENALNPGALQSFAEMLRYVTTRLAKMIVMDGEGATKRVEIRVSGAKSARDAERAGRAIADSSLVKTAFFGEDPNWGRIMAAIGYSGVHVREEKIDISFDRIPVVKRGLGLGIEQENQAKKVMKQREFTLTVHLGLGSASAVLWTCDLSYDYIKINVGYRS